VAWDFLPLFQQCFSLSSETWKCQSPTTMSHIATFLSLFCDTCLTIWHFFLLAKTRSQKSKTLLQICLIVDKDKKYCRKSTRVFNLSEMHSKSCNKMLVSLSVT
jgi:hypothetical protein